MNTDHEPEGGPAFPCDWMDFQPGTGNQVAREQYFGMTLRDYFAAKALPEASQWKRATSAGYAVSCDEIADLAYQMSEAMLKRRLKKI